MSNDAFWDNWTEHLFDPDATEIEGELTVANLEQPLRTMKEIIAMPDAPLLDDDSFDDERTFWTGFMRPNSGNSDDDSSEVFRTIVSASPQLEEGKIRYSSSTIPVLRSILSSSSSVHSGSSSKRTPRSVTFSDLPDTHYEYDESEDSDYGGDYEHSAPDAHVKRGGKSPRRSARVSLLQRILQWVRRSKIVSESAAASEKVLLPVRPVISGPIPLAPSLSRRSSSRTSSHCPPHRPRKLWHVWPSISCGIP